METRGRNVAEIELNTDELGYLQSLLPRRNLPYGESRRARALILMHEGLNNKTIAGEVGVCAHTVISWCKRFVTERLQGVSELPRSGAPLTISDDKVQYLCNELP